MKEESKATKKGPERSRLLKLGLLLAVFSVLSYQLYSIDWKNAAGLTIHYPLALIAAFLLVSANLGLEFLKWNLIARQITEEKLAIRSAFWSGIATGFITPNGWGNFLGRLLFFRKREMLYITIATAFSNLSQLVPTLIFGIWAASSVFPKLIWFFVLSGFVLLFLYFFADLLIPVNHKRYKWLKRFKIHASIYQKLKIPLLVLSTCRFVVFSLQFVLLFMAFGYTDFWFLMEKVWLIYFITSFVPSLWSGKILIRESAALFVFANSAVETPDIIVVSLLVYLINIALPAMWSSLIWMPKQLKK